MKEYVPAMNKMTDLFSTDHPDFLLNLLVEYANKVGISSMKVSDDKFKIKLSFLLASGFKMNMNIEFLDAGNEKVCIEFTKTEGDSIAFLEEFNTIKCYLGDAIDTTYTSA